MAQHVEHITNFRNLRQSSIHSTTAAFKSNSVHDSSDNNNAAVVIEAREETRDPGTRDPSKPSSYWKPSPRRVSGFSDRLSALKTQEEKEDASVLKAHQRNDTDPYPNPYISGPVYEASYPFFLFSVLEALQRKDVEHVRRHIERNPTKHVNPAIHLEREVSLHTDPYTEPYMDPYLTFFWWWEVSFHCGKRKPIHIAAQGGDLEMVKLLVTHRADVNVKGPRQNRLSRGG